MKLICILIFLLFPLHESEGTITDFCGGIDVPSDAYRIGETFTFTCPCSDCSDVVFTKSSSQADDERIMERATVFINSTVAQLDMVLSSTDMGGNYRCCRDHCSDPNKYRRVRVGAPPGPPRNVSCYTKGFKDLHCSWKHDVEQTKDIAVLYWGYFANTQYQNPRMDDFRWQDGSKTDQSPKFQVEMPGNHDQTYYVKLCARNVFNCTCGVHRLGTLIDIMSPNAVGNLDVTSATASTISLEWKTPSDLEYSLDSVVYRVDWSAAGATLDSLHSRKKSNVTVPNTTAMWVRGLQPNAVYNVAVYPRPYSWDAKKATGFWGTPSNISVRTKPDVPQRAPEIDPGMYFRHSCGKDNKNNCITFYFRPLPKDQWTADSIYYNLKLLESIDRSSKLRQRSFHNVSHSNFKYEYQANKAQDGVQIELRACSEIGCSSASSIVVPPKETIQGIKVTGHLINGSRQSVSWKGPSNVDYIVYWCEKGRNEHCKDSSEGSLKMQDPGANRTVEISLNDSSLHSFAVSAVKFDEHLKRNVSGGLFWLTTESVVNVPVQSDDSKGLDTKVIIITPVVCLVVMVVCGFIVVIVWYIRYRRKAIKRAEDDVPLPDIDPLIEPTFTRNQTGYEEATTMLLDRAKPTANSGQHLITTEAGAVDTDVYGTWDTLENESDGYPREAQKKTEYGALDLGSSSDSSECSTSGYPEDLDAESDSGALLYSTSTSEYGRAAASDAPKESISVSEFAEDSGSESRRQDTGYGALGFSGGEDISYGGGIKSQAVPMSESSDSGGIVGNVDSSGVGKDDRIMVDEGGQFGIADFDSASSSYETEAVEQPGVTNPSNQFDNPPSLLKDSSDTFGSDESGLGTGIDDNDNYRGVEDVSITDTKHRFRTGNENLTHFRPDMQMLDNVPVFRVCSPNGLDEANSDGTKLACTGQDSSEKNRG